MELFHDILASIQNESYYGEMKRTRVQQRCNMSYDKFSRYIDELKEKKLIIQDSPLHITDKGKRFLRDYDKIKIFLKKMELEYMTETGEDPNGY